MLILIPIGIIDHIGCALVYVALSSGTAGGVEWRSDSWRITYPGAVALEGPLQDQRGDNPD